MTRFVVIGGGSAGTRAAETIRDLRPDDPITLISEEERPFYLRPLLADFVAGRLQEKDLWLDYEATAARKGLTLMPGRKVVGLDYRHQRSVSLDNGEALPYDSMLIATGLKPMLPKIAGAELQGITAFSAYADAIRVRQWAENAKRAVVIGRGLPALELTRALRLRGLAVTLLAPDDSPWFLPLFDTAQEEIEALLARHEVNVVALDEPVEFVGKAGKVALVRTREGRELPADIVGVASHQKASIDFLAGSDMGVDEGILVDERLRSADERIFAAGDVAQVQEEVRRRALGYGWMRAGAQGEVAARNMCGGNTSVSVGDEYQAESLYGISLAARWQ